MSDKNQKASPDAQPETQPEAQAPVGTPQNVQPANAKTAIETARLLKQLPSIDSLSILEMRAMLRCSDPRCSCRLVNIPGFSHCPAHKGMFPALVLKKNAKGKLLCKCHRGCSSREVRDAMCRVFAAKLQARADSTIALPSVAPTPQVGTSLPKYTKPEGPDSIPASDMAIWFNLTERNEAGEWVGPNPFDEEGGATDNSFILSAEGVAYDCHLKKSYSREEIIELALKLEYASQRTARMLRSLR